VNIYRSQRRLKNTVKLLTHFRFGILFPCLAFVEIFAQRVAKDVHTYACISIFCFLDISFNFLPPEFWAYKYNYLQVLLQYDFIKVVNYANCVLSLWHGALHQKCLVSFVF